MRWGAVGELSIRITLIQLCNSAPLFLEDPDRVVRHLG